MEIFNKNNIVNYWEEILSKEDYKKIYKQIRREILEEMFKEHFVEKINKSLSGYDKDEFGIIKEE